MRQTFLQLWERIQLEETDPDLDDSEVTTPLMGSGEEGPAMQVIRAGLNLRSGDCGNFWEDFMQLLGNKEGLSDLLGVSQEDVSEWYARIKENLDKVGNNDKEKKKVKVTPTGGGKEPIGDDII